MTFALLLTACRAEPIKYYALLPRKSTMWAPPTGFRHRAGGHAAYSSLPQRELEAPEAHEGRDESASRALEGGMCPALTLTLQALLRMSSATMCVALYRRRNPH